MFRLRLWVEENVVLFFIICTNTYELFVNYFPTRFRQPSLDTTIASRQSEIAQNVLNRHTESIRC